MNVSIEQLIRDKLEAHYLVSAALHRDITWLLALWVDDLTAAEDWTELIDDRDYWEAYV